jgi:predicted nucleic acid-binding protein
VSFLLDTNVISELRRRRQSNELLFRWRDTVEGEETYISVITVLELEFGAKQIVAGAPHAALLRRWIDEDILSSIAMPFFG